MVIYWAPNNFSYSHFNTWRGAPISLPTGTSKYERKLIRTIAVKLLQKPVNIPLDTFNGNIKRLKTKKKQKKKQDVNLYCEPEQKKYKT